MTDTTTTLGADKPVELDPTREQLFIRRLAAGQRAGTLKALQHWHPGDIDPRMIAFTQDASRADYVPWALTAKLFAIFHSGRSDIRYGYPGNGIGRWARRADASPVNVDRLIATLTRTQDPLDLDRHLSALARMNTKGARYSPHWEAVLAELVTWNQAATRDDTRFAWARDYHTFTAPNDTTGTTT